MNTKKNIEWEGVSKLLARTDIGSKTDHSLTVCLIILCPQHVENASFSVVQSSSGSVSYFSSSGMHEQPSINVAVGCTQISGFEWSSPVPGSVRGFCGNIIYRNQRCSQILFLQVQVKFEVFAFKLKSQVFGDELKSVWAVVLQLCHNDTPHSIFYTLLQYYICVVDNKKKRYMVSMCSSNLLKTRNFLVNTRNTLTRKLGAHLCTRELFRVRRCLAMLLFTFHFHWFLSEQFCMNFLLSFSLATVVCVLVNQSPPCYASMQFARLT